MNIRYHISMLALATGISYLSFLPAQAETLYTFEGNMLFMGIYNVREGTTIKDGSYEHWWIVDDWMNVAGSNLTVEEVYEHGLLAAIKEQGYFSNGELHGNRTIYGYAGHTPGTRYYGASFDDSGIFYENWS